MKLPSCAGCGRHVLEVEGQFEVLDSYYLDENGPPEESAGDWHSACLLGSSYGPAWHQALLKNHTIVRGYRSIASTPNWSVVQHPRTEERLAFSRQGILVSLGFQRAKSRRVAGGSIYPVEEAEYRLELEDGEIIRAMQESLLSVKTFPVLAVFEALDIADRVLHPEALEGSLIHFERSLRRFWSPRFLSARWEYGVFVPDELEEFVVRQARNSS